MSAGLIPSTDLPGVHGRRRIPRVSQENLPVHVHRISEGYLEQCL